MGGGGGGREMESGLTVHAEWGSLGGGGWGGEMESGLTVHAGWGSLGGGGDGEWSHSPCRVGIIGGGGGDGEWSHSPCRVGIIGGGGEMESGLTVHAGWGSLGGGGGGGGGRGERWRVVSQSMQGGDHGEGGGEMESGLTVHAGWGSLGGGGGGGRDGEWSKSMQDGVHWEGGGGGVISIYRVGSLRILEGSKINGSSNNVTLLSIVILSKSTCHMYLYITVFGGSHVWFLFTRADLV